MIYLYLFGTCFHFIYVFMIIGNKKVSLYELQGFDHGQVYVPGCCLVANYIRNFIADGR